MCQDTPWDAAGRLRTPPVGPSFLPHFASRAAGDEVMAQRPGTRPACWDTWDTWVQAASKSGALCGVAASLGVGERQGRGASERGRRVQRMRSCDDVSLRRRAGTCCAVAICVLRRAWKPEAEASERAAPHRAGPGCRDVMSAANLRACALSLSPPASYLVPSCPRRTFRPGPSAPAPTHRRTRAAAEHAERARVHSATPAEQRQRQRQKQRRAAADAERRARAPMPLLHAPHAGLGPGSGCAAARRVRPEPVRLRALGAGRWRSGRGRHSR